MGKEKITGLEKIFIKEKENRHRVTERPKYMSEEHKMTAKDKLVLTATLAIIFFGILGLGLIGLIFNLSG